MLLIKFKEMQNSQINCSFAYYSNSSFVPTISALAFNSNDLFYKIGEDPNRLSKTPFSDIFGFSGENRSHTNSIAISQSLTDWIISKIDACQIQSIQVTNGNASASAKNITIQGDINPQQLIFLKANENIVVLPNTTLHPNVSLQIVNCPITSGGRIATPDTLHQGLNENNQSIENQVDNPSPFSIYPNPTSGNTVVVYSLNKSSYSKISILNLSGQVIATPLDQFKEVGMHNIEFNASNLPAGMYIIKFESEKLSRTEKLVVIK